MDNCYISEITVAELKYGVECSDPAYMDEKRRRLNDFLFYIQVIPVNEALDVFAREKARLRAVGELISDFDLLIGATSVARKLTMVSNNPRHLSKIQGIILEDWTDRGQ